MTRNLREPLPEIRRIESPAGKGKAHAALDAALDAAICRGMTGKIKVEIDMNEGGVRAVKIGTEEIYKPTT